MNDCDDFGYFADGGIEDDDIVYGDLEKPANDEEGKAGGEWESHHDYLTKASSFSFRLSTHYYPIDH